MIKRSVVYLLFFNSLILVAQDNVTKTWSDSMSDSDYVIRHVVKTETYTFMAEKYKRAGEFGPLAEGNLERIKQVVNYMDDAFQAKDSEKLFALGRYKYTFTAIKVNEILVIEALKIEDLLKDDHGKKPVYMMSSETLSSIKAYVFSLKEALFLNLDQVQIKEL